MWLGEQITEHGVGNGMSLLIFFSIIEGFPSAVVRTWEAMMVGEIGFVAMVALLAVVVGVTAGVTSMTMAARQVPVQIPRKVVGRGRIQEGQKSFIPIRVNAAGVMPIIFAQSFIIVPGTLAAFTSSGIIAEISDMFQPGNWLYYVTYGLLTIFFTYFYTAIIFNPVDLAENLKKQGAFIPGVKPGSRTAEYIDRVLTRVTLPGAIYLALIALLPLLDLRHLRHPDLLLRRNRAPHRGGRRARHRAARAAAPPAPPLRRVHEEGAGEGARPPELHVRRRIPDGGHSPGTSRGREGNAGRPPGG
jgi:preprotein translocase subunit SecY